MISRLVCWWCLSANGLNILGLGWVNADDLFTLDITQVGSMFGGERLVVTVRF